MSNLWVTAAHQGSWEDASQEGNVHRLDRAHQWVDKHDVRNEDIPIPENFGEHGPYLDDDHLPPNEHWHHLPLEPVDLRQKIITHQRGVDAYTLRKKIDERHPDYDDNDYGFHGDTQEKDTDPKDPLFFKQDRQMHLFDGHHRFVTDRLTGKDSTLGKVYDKDDPRKNYEKCRQCQRGW